VCHYKGFAYFTDEDDVISVFFQGFFIVLDGFFWFLDVHEGLSSEFEIIDAWVGV
jgi:hypothetical protein